jgi:hypothetical protein
MTKLRAPTSSSGVFCDRILEERRARRKSALRRRSSGADFAAQLVDQPK